MNHVTCVQCQSVMSPGAGSRIKLYCSDVCKNAAKWARRKAVYHQERSNGQVPRMRLAQIARDRKRGVQPMYSEEVKVCAACRSKFQGVWNQVYCSVDCRKKAALARERRAAFLASRSRHRVDGITSRVLFPQA